MLLGITISANNLGVASHKTQTPIKHCNLPYGKDLQGDELRKDLTNLFQIYGDHASKLAPISLTRGHSLITPVTI